MPTRPNAGRSRLLAAPLALVLAGLPGLPFAAPAHTAPAHPGPRAAAPARPLSPAEGARIVAVVNGDVISMADVDNRRRLFALSTGLPLTPDVLRNLDEPIIQQLIDEKLRLQEMQRRHIAVPEEDIAKALQGVAQENGLTLPALRARLATAGINMSTMIDQVRVQIGWGGVLHQILGAQAQISDADIAALERTLTAEKGQTEYNIGEIFIPISNQTQTTEAERFADTVIGRLRAGAPFPVVAAQFSQSQTALQGGSRGWIQANQVSPDELRVMNEMPVGAISNPIKVPGGLSIITLRAKRQIGQEHAVMVAVRQVFLPFSVKLNPQAPTAQQRQMLDEATTLSQVKGGCDAMDTAADRVPGAKKINPGEIALESIAAPVVRQLVATLPIGQASKPLIADDGVAVVMVCSRADNATGLPPKSQLATRILNQRIELASRQLMRDLRRQAEISLRS